MRERARLRREEGMGRKEAEHGPCLMDNSRDSLPRSTKNTTHNVR